MEPKELRQAREFLSNYDKDNRKIINLELGLKYLYNVIEGEYEETYIKIANNILNAYRNKIIGEANNLLSNYSYMTLSKVSNLNDKIIKFIESDFDCNGELSSLRKKLFKIEVGLTLGLTPKQEDSIE